MTYRVEIVPGAEREFRKLSVSVQSRIRPKLIEGEMDKQAYPIGVEVRQMAGETADNIRLAGERQPCGTG